MFLLPATEAVFVPLAAIIDRATDHGELARIPSCRPICVRGSRDSRIRLVAAALGLGLLSRPKNRGAKMPTQYDFSQRSGVVTGGAQGIGRAVVERLMAGGAAIAIWDRDKPLAEKTAKELASRGKVIAVGVDVTDFPSVERARDETLKAFGRIDILVNNAGIAGPIAKTWEHSTEEWDQVLRINLTGQFNCCKAIVPGMIAQNYGRIANVASIAGKEGNPNAAAYSASKAGVIGMTKSLGKELATYDIAVNAITPAVAKTAILDTVTQQHIDYMLSKIPRGRLVRVDEIAATIAFMVSEECSFTTGFTFDITGGRATY
jgi:2-dehydro-3-deoxy-L-rhamnonate dehydrogenase (NAD+)